MRRAIVIVFSFLVLLTAASCASSGKATYAHQRQGLLMMEGENIHKNKGFYSSKKSHKRRKNNKRAGKKYYSRR